MNNAEDFLDIYNQVDDLLKKSNSEKYVKYSDKIKESKIPVVIEFRDKLLDYGELRNAMVHRPKEKGEYIAVPLKKVVTDFEEILKELRNPKKVLPEFQREVIGADKSEKLDEVLKKMREKSLSQIPIFDNGQVIEIINTNTISRWLGRNINEEGIMEENPVISVLFEDFVP